MAEQGFGFPLLLGAHDHCVYTNRHGPDNCAVLKSGMDAHNALVIDISWYDGSDAPQITWELVKTKSFPADPAISAKIQDHMRPVNEYSKMHLKVLDQKNETLSSQNMRKEQTSVGSLLTDAIKRELNCDAVLLNAGAIRGDTNYPTDQTSFTFGDLKREMPFDSEVTVIKAPGQVLIDAVSFSRRFAPKESGGFLQVDGGVVVETNSFGEQIVATINGKPVDKDQMYDIGVFYTTLKGMDNVAPLKDFFTNIDKYPGAVVPPEGAATPAKALVMRHFASKLWEHCAQLEDLDLDRDGIISFDELKVAMEKLFKGGMANSMIQNMLEAIQNAKANGHVAKTTPKLEQESSSISHHGREAVMDGAEALKANIIANVGKRVEGISECASDAEPYPPTGLSGNIRKLPEWIQLGCGDAPYNCAEKNATFAIDGKSPDAMPDLTNHSNFMSECLTPEIWEALKDKTTSGGTTLAECIKTGVDNPGHPHIKTVGMTACDEESYEVFKELFDPVISARHGGYAPDASQPTNLDTTQLLDTDIDPEGKYVLTTRVRTGRSVKGFKLPPTISFEDRRKLEALSVKALLAMEGDLKGDYFPLHGSKSYAPKPTGMSEEKEESLRKCGNLFQEPDSTLLLASGMGRHWPDGRGVFHNENNNLFVWVGEEDHLRIVSMQGSRDAPTPEGKNIKEVTARFMDACAEVQKVLKAEGADFMHNDHLGWVLTCPSNLGTGLRAGTMVKLPNVSGRDDWKALCAKMGLQARGTGGVDSDNVGGTWDVSNADRIGKGEVDLVNTLISGAAQLVQWETLYDAGKGEEAAAEIAARLA